MQAKKREEKKSYLLDDRSGPGSRQTKKDTRFRVQSASIIMYRDFFGTPFDGLDWTDLGARVRSWFEPRECGYLPAYMVMPHVRAW
jgi:hypothetical protein